MDKQSVMNGLQEAQELLSDCVPVVMAWEAIKAIKAAIGLLEVGGKNAEAV